MPKPNTIAWSSREKKNLLPWLLQRQRMTWNAKAKAYFKQFGLKRTGEALRSKRNYLLRKHRAKEKSMSNTSWMGHRPWVLSEDTPRAFLPPPPIFTPRARNIEAFHLSHVKQDLATANGRFFVGALGSADQTLRDAISLPHNLRSDPKLYVSYLWEFVHRVAAARKASRNATIR
ncbi:unnamed protein product [Penicillium olsonii]|nr:unnamed protein product [Penicillium olsonii]CAG7932844.1 unnamed protein product [Penicillium olsonii]CAG8260903.1 unnamed protein product [Penicillium olsonii]